MSFNSIYLERRAAAAAAWGWQALASGSEPNMSSEFALELVELWNALGEDGADQLSIDVEGTRVGKSYGYEQVDNARWRLATLGPGIAGDVGPDGLLVAPGQLWTLVAKLARSLDAMAAEPTKTDVDYDVLTGSVRDTLTGLADAALAGVKAVGNSLEAPLVLLAVGLGLYLVVSDAR